MSAHKASVARCLSEHQAWSGQPAIWALPRSPIRRLALSLLFTIVTTSYQTTCTVSERTSIKGTCQCNLHGVALTLLRQGTQHDFHIAGTNVMVLPHRANTQVTLQKNTPGFSISRFHVVWKGFEWNEAVCPILTDIVCVVAFCFLLV